MRRRHMVCLAGALMLAAGLGCGNTTPNQNTPTGEITGTPEPTKEATPEPTKEATPEPTKEATPEPSKEATPEPTKEATPTEQGELNVPETDENQDIDEKNQEEIVMNGRTIEVECPTTITMAKAGVNYGTVKHDVYHSETTGMDRGVNILLPGNYSEDKKYPVMYLLHGIFGDEYSFMGDANNRIKEISANLAAEGTTKEMIIVMPNMYAAWDESQKPGFSQEAVAPYDNFINDLVNDLMPYMEANYSILTGRDNTAIAGFSMGGRETLFIGLTRPDLFGYIGAIAPAPGVTPAKDWAMTHVGQMAEADMHFPEDAELPYVFMVCCGTKDSVVGKFPESYHNILTTNEVEHTWYEVPGADHDTKAIRSGFYNFTASIFHN